MTRLRTGGAALAVAGLALAGLALAAPAHAASNIVDLGNGTAAGYWSVPETTWPQPAIPADACGTGTIQRDIYPYGTPEEKTRTDALPADGLLQEGEDYGWAISWTIYAQTPCATTTPTEVSSSTPTPTGTPTPSPTPTATTAPTPEPTQPQAVPVTPRIDVAPTCEPGSIVYYNVVTPTPTPGITWSTDGFLGGTDYIATPEPGYVILGPLAHHGRITGGKAVFHIGSLTSPTRTCPTTSTPPAPSTTSSTPAHTSTSGPSRTSTATPSLTLAAGTVNGSGRMLQKAGTGQDTDALAYTGSNPALGFGIGFATFTVGLILAAVSRRKGKKS